MGLCSLWRDRVVTSHYYGFYGKFGVQQSLVGKNWTDFQQDRKDILTAHYNEDNHTPQVCQDALNSIWPKGSLTTINESEIISFDAILIITASEQGAIQMRDLIVDRENGTAVVVAKCTLKDKLKAVLRRMEYSSGDVDAHVCRRFIRGIFGK
jgi:hypothetical protein